MNNVLYGSTFSNSSRGRKRRRTSRRRARHSRGLNESDYIFSNSTPINSRGNFRTNLNALRYRTTNLIVREPRDNNHIPLNYVERERSFQESPNGYVNDTESDIENQLIVNDTEPYNENQLIDTHNNEVLVNLKRNVTNVYSTTVENIESFTDKCQSTPVLEDKLNTIHEDSASAVSSTLTPSALSDTSLVCQAVGRKQKPVESLNSKQYKSEHPDADKGITGGSSRSLLISATAYDEPGLPELSRSGRFHNWVLRWVNRGSESGTHKSSLETSTNTKTTVLVGTDNLPTGWSESISPRTRLATETGNAEITNNHILNDVRQCQKKGKLDTLKNLFCCIHPNRSETSLNHEIHDLCDTPNAAPVQSPCNTDFKAEYEQARRTIQEHEFDKRSSSIFVEKSIDNYKSRTDYPVETKTSCVCELIRESLEDDTISTNPDRISRSSVRTIVNKSHSQTALALEKDQVTNNLYSRCFGNNPQDQLVVCTNAQYEEVIGQSEFQYILDYGSASGEEHSEYYQINDRHIFPLGADKTVIPVKECIKNIPEPETHEENFVELDTNSDTSDMLQNTEEKALRTSVTQPNLELKDAEKNLSPQQHNGSTYVLDISFHDDQLLKYIGESNFKTVLKTMAKDVISKNFDRKLKREEEKNVGFSIEQHEAHTSMSYENVEIGTQTSNYLTTEKRIEISQDRESEDERTTVIETLDLLDALNEVKKLRKQLLENCTCSQRIVDVSLQTSLECLHECALNKTKPLLVENSVQTNDTFQINFNVGENASPEVEIETRKKDTPFVENVNSPNCSSKQTSENEKDKTRHKTFDDNVVCWLWNPIDHKTYNFHSWPLEAVFSKVNISERNCNKKPLKAPSISNKKHQLQSGVLPPKKIKRVDDSKHTKPIIRKIIKKKKSGIENQKTKIVNESNQKNESQTQNKDCRYRVNLAHKKYFNVKTHHRKTVEFIPYSLRSKGTQKESKQRLANKGILSSENSSLVSDKENCLVTCLEPNYKESTSCSLSFSLPTRFVSPLSSEKTNRSSTIRLSDIPSLEVDLSPGNTNLPKKESPAVVPETNIEFQTGKKYLKKHIYNPNLRSAHHSKISKEVKELFLVSRTLMSSTESNDSQYIDKSFSFPAEHVILQNSKNNISVRKERTSTETRATTLVQSMQNSSQFNCLTDSSIWKNDFSHKKIGNSLSYWPIDPSVNGFPFHTDKHVKYFGAEQGNKCMNYSSHVLDSLSIHAKKPLKSDVFFNKLGKDGLYSRENTEVLYFDVLNETTKSFSKENNKCIVSQKNPSTTDINSKIENNDSNIIQHFGSYMKPTQSKGSQILLEGVQHGLKKQIVDKKSSSGEERRRILKSESRKNNDDTQNMPNYITSFPKSKRSQGIQTSPQNFVACYPRSKDTTIHRAFLNSPQAHFHSYGMYERKPEGVRDVMNSESFQSDDETCSISSSRVKTVLDSFVDGFRSVFHCFRPCTLFQHLNPWKNKTNKLTVGDPYESEEEEEEEGETQRDFSMPIEDVNYQHAPKPFRHSLHCSKHSHISRGQSQQSFKHTHQSMKHSQQSLKHSHTMIHSHHKFKPKIDQTAKYMSPYSMTDSLQMTNKVDSRYSGHCKKHFGRFGDLKEAIFNDDDIRHACHTVYNTSIQSYNKSRSCEEISQHKVNQPRQQILSSGSSFPYEGFVQKTHYPSSYLPANVYGEGDYIEKSTKGPFKSIIFRCKKKLQKKSHPPNCRCEVKKENNETEIQLNHDTELNSDMCDRSNVCSKNILFFTKRAGKYYDQTV